MAQQFEQQLWFRLLTLLLQATTCQLSQGHLQLTLSLQLRSQLQVELLALANPDAVSQWQSALQAMATTSNASWSADDHQIAQLCQLMQPLLQASAGQLVLEPQADGYLLRWTTPVQVPEFQPVASPCKEGGIRQWQGYVVVSARVFTTALSAVIATGWARIIAIG